MGDEAETTAPVNSASRRRVAAGLAGIAVAPAAPAAAVEAPAADETLMREALALAAQADLPFGAVIVRDGEILARGMNSGKREKDPTAHGEMVAIRRFLSVYGPEALRGTTLYTSGEPCPMCMAAIIWCGIGRVVYGASITQLSAVIGQIMLPSAEVAAKTDFAMIEITGGVLADEAIRLFR